MPYINHDHHHQPPASLENHKRNEEEEEEEEETHCCAADTPQRIPLTLLRRSQATCSKLRTMRCSRPASRAAASRNQRVRLMVGASGAEAAAPRSRNAVRSWSRASYLAGLEYCTARRRRRSRCRYVCTTLMPLGVMVDMGWDGEVVMWLRGVLMGGFLGLKFSKYELGWA